MSDRTAQPKHVKPPKGHYFIWGKRTLAHVAPSLELSTDGQHRVKTLCGRDVPVSAWSRKRRDNGSFCWPCFAASRRIAAQQDFNAVMAAQPQPNLDDDRAEVNRAISSA